MPKPSVETSMASAAGRNGPTVRLASRRSRFFLIGEHLLQGGELAARLQVGQSAPGTLQRAGGEKNLALGLRKGHRSLVPPLGHHVAAAGQALLESHQVGANLRIVGAVVGYRRYFRRTHGVGHVLAVEINPAAVYFHLQRVRQFGQPLRAGSTAGRVAKRPGPPPDTWRRYRDIGTPIAGPRPGRQCSCLPPPDRR